MAVSVVKGLLSIACFYLFIRLPFAIIQQILWLIGGTRAELKLRYEGRKYESSAHVRDIVMKGGRLGNPTPRNILAQHVNWEHPEYVLSDKCSIFYIDSKTAYFIEVPPFERVDSVNLHDFSTVGYMGEAQFRHSHRLIPLPLASFEHLAEKVVGCPSSRPLFIHHTGRAGATLLAQIIAKTGDVLVVNEPAVFSSLAKLKSRYSPKEYYRLLHNAVRMLLKPQKDKTFGAYFIKTPGNCPALATDLMKALPGAQHYFVYQDGLKTVQTKVSEASESLASQVALTMFSRFPTSLPYIKALPAGVLDVIKDRCDATYYTLTWAQALTHYTQAVKDGSKVKGVRFGDLVGDNKEKIIKAVLESANRSQEAIDRAVKGFDEVYSEWSKTSSAHNNDDASIKAVMVQCDAICDKMEVPRLSATCRLPGTLEAE